MYVYVYKYRTGYAKRWFFISLRRPPQRAPTAARFPRGTLFPRRSDAPPPPLNPSSRAPVKKNFRHARGEL